MGDGHKKVCERRFVMDKSTDLVAMIRGTGSVREFTDEPVDDAVLTRILDHARFAPNGGNRQAWHVVVMKDPVLRTALRELYLGPWRDYFARVIRVLAGLDLITASNTFIYSATHIAQRAA